MVNKVAELFMKHHVERREQVASATVAALQGRAGDAAAAAGRRPTRPCASSRSSTTARCPSSRKSNLRTLDQTTMEVNIQSTNLDMDQERRRAAAGVGDVAAASSGRDAGRAALRLEHEVHDGQPRGEEDPVAVRVGARAAPRGRARAERQGPPQQPRAGGARGRHRSHQGDGRRAARAPGRRAQPRRRRRRRTARSWPGCSRRTTASRRSTA